MDVHKHNTHIKKITKRQEMRGYTSYITHNKKATVAKKLTESMTRNSKEHYPVDWQIIAREIKEAVDYTCQECGQKCRKPGELNLGWQYMLTVAHWDREYDSAAVFCVALCVKCHFGHDCRHSWTARRRHAYIRQRIAGQLGLLLDAKIIIA